MNTPARRAAKKRYEKRRMANDPIYRQRVRRREQLRHKYHITLSDYDLLLQVQRGVCAICGELPADQTLGVDHNHETKYVRGLLCRSCNVGLGHFRDDPTLLQKAIDYLQHGLHS